MNTDDPWPDADAAWWRVQKIQTKLHQWANDDPDRRFDDLWNLVYDSAVLADAWHRVRSNRGARSAGVDGESAFYVSVVRGEQVFLSELREELKARRFCPVAVREVMIPVGSGGARDAGRRATQWSALRSRSRVNDLGSRAPPGRHDAIGTFGPPDRPTRS